MGARGDRVRKLLSTGFCAVALVGCGGAITLGVDPTEPAPIESLPAPPLGEHAYRKILLLPPSDPVNVRDVEFEPPRDAKAGYYVGKIEKLLLAQGFEVISSEIVARAEAEAGGASKLSSAEKAMVLGRQTKADAVLMLQSVNVRGLARYFDADEAQTVEVEESHVRKDEDGEYYDKESERCLHRLPYYEVQVEAKLIDAQTGAVLWVGSGRGSSIDVIQDRWVAEVDDDCEILDQNFVYDDYQRDESTFDNTVTTLFKRLVAPFAKVALAGTEIDREPAPPAPAPPPPPAEAPAVKMALVTSAGAALRDGPSRKNPKRMTVPRKAKVEVLETMGEWTKVKIQDGTVGWMHESTIIVPE